MDLLVRDRADLLVAAVLATALVQGCGTPQSPASRPTVLPDLRVTTLDDRPTQLSTVLAHRPALVAVWATWCDACRREQPALDRLDLAAAPRGGVVVGLSVGESSEVVRAQLARRPVRYLQVLDEPFALADTAGVHSLPTVFVIDAEGRVVHAGGALDPAALAAFRRVLGAE